jgi:hypothetical protein
MMPGVDAGFHDVQAQDLGFLDTQALGYERNQSQFRRGMAKVSNTNFHH